MLNFKENRSKILSVAAIAISCASLALSATALNGFKKDCPPEQPSQNEHREKGEHMGHRHNSRPDDFGGKGSQDSRPGDCDGKGPQGENHRRPEDSQKNEKHEGPNGNEKHEGPNGNEKPQENSKN
jgi:hypothetical protein